MRRSHGIELQHITRDLAMRRSGRMEMNLGLIRWPLTIAPAKKIDHFGLNCFQVNQLAARCGKSLVPDVETHRLEGVPPGVAVIAVFTVCGPTEPEPVGHRLFGHPNVDRMVMVVDDIELGRAAGRPVTKSTVAQRCLDREAPLRHHEVVAIWPIKLHGSFTGRFQCSAHNARAKPRRPRSPHPRPRPWTRAPPGPGLSAPLGCFIPYSRFALVLPLI